MPVTIGTSSATNILASMPQRKILKKINGRYWIFYSDGTNFGWRSSTDGSSWTSFNTYTSSSSSHIASIWWDDTYVQIGWNPQANDKVYYQRGTLNADGSITWDTLRQATPTGTYKNFSNVTKDSDGYPWVSYSYGLPSPYKVKCRKALAQDGSSWDVEVALDTDAISTVLCVLLPLSGGRLLAVWLNDTPAAGSKEIRSAYYHYVEPIGFIWDSKTTVTSNVNGQNYWAVHIENDVVHLLYYTGSALKYRQWTESGGWTGEESVNATGGHCEITADGTTVYAFWCEGTYVYTKTRSGGVWGDATAIASSETGGAQQIECVFDVVNYEIPLAWAQGSGGTKNVRWHLYSPIPSASKSLSSSFTPARLSYVRQSVTFGTPQKFLTTWNTDEEIVVDNISSSAQWYRSRYAAFQRTVFIANDRYWKFYHKSDTGKIAFKSRLRTKTGEWSAETELDHSGSPGRNGFDLYVDRINNYIYAAVLNKDASPHALYFRRGLLNLDGSITWLTPWKSVPDTTPYKSETSITVYNNQVYIVVDGWQYSPDACWIRIWKSTDLDGSAWSEAWTKTGTGSNSSTMILRNLTSGIVCLYWPFEVVNLSTVYSSNGTTWIDGPSVPEVYEPYTDAQPNGNTLILLYEKWPTVGDTKLFMRARTWQWAAASWSAYSQVHVFDNRDPDGTFSAVALTNYQQYTFLYYSAWTPGQNYDGIIYRRPYYEPGFGAEETVHTCWQLNCADLDSPEEVTYENEQLLFWTVGTATPDIYQIRALGMTVTAGTQIKLGPHTFEVGPEVIKRYRLAIAILEIPDGIDQVQHMGRTNKEIILTTKELSKTQIDDLVNAYVLETQLALNIPYFEENKTCRVSDLSVREVAGLQELTYWEVTITVVLIS